MRSSSRSWLRVSLVPGVLVLMLALTGGDARAEQIDWSQYLETSAPKRAPAAQAKAARDKRAAQPARKSTRRSKARRAGKQPTRRR